MRKVALIGRSRHNEAVGFEYLVIAFSFGLATAIIGKGKGGSFWLWLLIGTALPPFGRDLAELGQIGHPKPLA